MQFKLSDRLNRLPPYLFIDIDRAKRKAISEGKDVIDLGIGDPDTSSPKEIIERLYKESTESDSDSARIRALELLGKSVAMFTDVTEQKESRDSTEIEQEIEERITQLLNRGES